MISEEIKRLHALHLDGALTDAEFARAKARLLERAAESPSAPGLPGQLNRLRRARSDRLLGGVCGGLARVSGMQSWVWRVLFLLFALSFGFGLVIYILLWIFVPDEEIGKINNE